MIDLLVFWLVVAGLGVAALPFAEVLLGRLPGRGLVFARPLGLLVVAFPVWLLASLHVVPSGCCSAFLAIAVVLVLAAVLRLRGLGRLRRSSHVTSVWLVGELVFTVTFAGWALLRSFAPDVWQTEKPMDMALVNVVNRAEWFP